MISKVFEYEANASTTIITGRLVGVCSDVGTTEKLIILQNKFVSVYSYICHSKGHTDAASFPSSHSCLYRKEPHTTHARPTPPTKIITHPTPRFTFHLSAAAVNGQSRGTFHHQLSALSKLMITYYYCCCSQGEARKRNSNNNGTELQRKMLKKKK